MGTIYSSCTTIDVRQRKSRPITFRRAVEQGDPLSSFLFNIVVDKLLITLNVNPDKEGLTPLELEVRAIAFADNFILLEDRKVHMNIALHEAISFFEARGMRLNPKKCVSTM